MDKEYLYISEQDYNILNYEEVFAKLLLSHYIYMDDCDSMIKDTILSKLSYPTVNVNIDTIIPKIFNRKSYLYKYMTELLYGYIDELIDDNALEIVNINNNIYEFKKSYLDMPYYKISITDANMFFNKKLDSKSSFDKRLFYMVSSVEILNTKI